MASGLNSKEIANIFNSLENRCIELRKETVCCDDTEKLIKLKVDLESATRAKAAFERLEW